MQRRSPTIAERTVLRDFPFEKQYGVSRLSDQLTTPPDYFYTLKNFFVSRQNFIEQRNGYQKVTTNTIGATSKIRKIYEFMNKDGAKTVIARGGEDWWRMDSGELVSLDGSRTADAKGQCCTYDNYLIMTDGGAARKSTPTWTVSNVGNDAPTLSSLCHTHNHRLVLNNDDNLLEVYISKVDSMDFDTSADDAIVLNLSKIITDGDRIIGFSTFMNSYLVIWLKRHIVIYNVPTTFANISLQQVIHSGCISYDGVAEVGSDLYYPSETGIRSLAASLGTNNTMDTKDVSKHIDPYYRNSLPAISDWTDINAVYYKKLNHYYFTFPFTTLPEIWVISKDLELATGGKGNIAGHFLGINAWSFCQLETGELYFGGADGLIYRMDYGTNDDGAAIAVEATKTALYFGNSKVNKFPREFEALFIATDTLTATIEYGFGVYASIVANTIETLTINAPGVQWDADDAIWDSAEWANDGVLAFKSRNIHGHGKVMSISLKHETLDAQLKFPYWILSAFLGGDK